MRYISRFSETERNTLRSYLTGTALIERERKRLTAIFLSAQHGFSMPELARRFSVTPNSIQNWFNAYEKVGFAALLDKNMAHHCAHLSQYPAPTILASVESNPQNLRMVVADLAENHQIQTTKKQLQTYLKKRFTWPRIRKSVESQQDAVLFACFKQEIALLDALASSGDIQVW